MTTEQDKQFENEQLLIVAEGIALQRDTRDAIVRFLKIAEDKVLLQIASQPADYQLWHLTQLHSEVNRVLGEFQRDGAKTVSDAAKKSWELGIEQVDTPLKAMQLKVPPQLFQIDTHLLDTLSTFVADRIQNIGAEAINKISQEISMVAIGAQNTNDAIHNIKVILGDKSRERATTICRTELGRVLTIATHKRALQAVKINPGLRKKWGKSGKTHARLNHNLTHGQIRPIDKPFIIGVKTVDDKVKYDGYTEMMMPRDPSASASETINCGCLYLLHNDKWAEN